MTCSAQSYLGYTICPTYLTDSTGHHQVVHTGKGDAIILPSLEHKHGMYKVVHIRSKKEGFISAHEITIEKAVPVSVESDLFTALANSDVKDPIIKIHNKSKKTMTVILNQDKYDIEPHQTTTIKTKAGKYHSKVIIPDTDPIYCLDQLEDYKLYDWNYFVGR
jgi:hypothetical protein